MGRHALTESTKQAIREVAVEFVQQKGTTTPGEVARALSQKVGPGLGVKLNSGRLGTLLRGEERIERRYNPSHQCFYIWRGP